MLFFFFTTLLGEESDDSQLRRIGINSEDLSTRNLHEPPSDNAQGSNPGLQGAGGNMQASAAVPRNPKPTENVIRIMHRASRLRAQGFEAAEEGKEG
jgi:hypothetical protein